jgi:hypothetical protein
MPVPACGGGRAREGASSEEEMNPRARRNSIEGSVSPRAGRSPLEGGAGPRARRSLLEGALDWATPVGRGGHRGVGRALRVRFKWEVFRFGSLQVLSRIPLVVLGDPQGCPRQKYVFNILWSDYHIFTYVLNSFCSVTSNANQDISHVSSWKYSQIFYCSGRIYLNWVYVSIFVLNKQFSFI